MVRNNMVMDTQIGTSLTSFSSIIRLKFCTEVVGDRLSINTHKLGSELLLESKNAKLKLYYVISYHNIHHFKPPLSSMMHAVEQHIATICQRIYPILRVDLFSHHSVNICKF